MSDSNIKERPHRQRIHLHLHEYEIKLYSKDHPQRYTHIDRNRDSIKRKHPSKQQNTKKSSPKSKPRSVPQFRIKKLRNHLLDKLVSLLGYTIQSADKAMSFIPLSTYFDANFQTRLYYSDRQNLMNWLNSLAEADIRTVDKLIEGRDQNAYQTVEEQYYRRADSDVRKSTRSKSQSIPNQYNLLQTNQQFNSLQPKPQNDFQCCYCACPDKKSQHHSSNSFQTQNQDLHYHSLTHHYIDQSTANQIRTDIERLKNDLQELRKMKKRNKSNESVYFEEKISIVEQVYKKCEDKMNMSEKHKKSVQKQIKPHKIKIAQDQLINLQNIEKEYHQIESLIKQKLLNLSFRSRPIIGQVGSKQQQGHQPKERSFHCSPLIRKSSLFEEVDGLVTELEKEVANLAKECQGLKNNRREKSSDKEMIRQKTYEIEQLRIKNQELKKKLQLAITSSPINQAQSHPIITTTNRLTIIQPSNYQASITPSLTTANNKITRLQTQLSVCKNNFKAFFTIIKNILMRYPTINNKKLDQNLVEELRTVEAKDGKVEKGMEVLIKLLDGIVAENTRLRIDAQAREDACNKSFTYIETRIEKNITSHILDQLERSRHSIQHSRHPQTTKSITTNITYPSQQLQALQIQLNSKDQTILKLSELLQAKELELSKIKIHVQKHQDHKNQTTKMLKHQNYTLEELKYMLEEREFELTNVKQQLQRKDEDLKQLEKYLHKVETHAVSVREQNSKLKDLIDENSKEIYSLKQEKTSILQYLSKLEIKEKKLEQLISDKDNQILELKNILREYEAGYKQLEQRYYNQVQNRLNSLGVSDQTDKGKRNAHSKHNHQNKKRTKTPTKHSSHTHILINESSPFPNQISQQANLQPTYINSSKYQGEYSQTYQDVDYLMQEKDEQIHQLKQQNEKMELKLQNNLQLMLSFRNQCNDLQAQINLLNSISNNHSVKNVIKTSEVIEERSQKDEQSFKKAELNDFTPIKQPIIEQPKQCPQCQQKQQKITKLTTQNSQLHQKLYQFNIQLQQLKEDKNKNEKQHQQGTSNHSHNCHNQNSVNSDTYYRYHNMINQQMKRVQECDHNIGQDSVEIQNRNGEDNSKNSNQQNDLANAITQSLPKKDSNQLINKISLLEQRITSLEQQLQHCKCKNSHQNNSFHQTPRYQHSIKERKHSIDSHSILSDEQNSLSSPHKLKPSNLLNELQLQGFKENEQSMNLSNNTTPRDINTDRSRQPHTIRSIQINTDRSMPPSHQVPYPQHQDINDRNSQQINSSKQLSQISPQQLSKSCQSHSSHLTRQQNQLLKRNRGDQRPSFLVYKTGNTLLSGIGIDTDPSSRQRVNSSKEDIEAVHPTGRQTDRSLKSNKTERNSVDNRGESSQKPVSQSSIESPRKILRREDSDTSRVEVDLNNDYRNDSLLEETQKITKHNSSQSGLVYPHIDPRPTYHSVRFDMNTIRETSQNSQTTSKVSTQKEKSQPSPIQSQINSNQQEANFSKDQKSHQKSQLQNPQQNFLETILNFLYPDSNNRQKNQCQVKQKSKDFFRVALDSRQSSQSIIKQLIHIVKSLRGQIQLLTTQYQSLNHQFIHLSHLHHLQSHHTDKFIPTHSKILVHQIPSEKDQQISERPSQLTQNVSCLLEEYDRKEDSIPDTVIHRLRSDHLISIGSKSSINQKEETNFVYIPEKIVTEQEIREDNQDNREVSSMHEKKHTNSQPYNMFDPQNYAIHMLKRNPFLQAIQKDSNSKEEESKNCLNVQQSKKETIQYLDKQNQERISKVFKENEENKQEAHKIKLLLGEKETEISALKNEIEIVRKQFEMKTEQLNKNMSQLEVSQVQKNLIKEQNKVLVDNTQKQTHQIQNLNYLLQQKEQKLTQLNQKLSQLLQTNTQLIHRNSLLERQHDLKSQKLQDFQNQLKSLTFQLSTLREQIKLVEEKANQFQRENHELKKRVKEMGDSHKQLELTSKETEQKYSKQSVQYTHILNQYKTQYDQVTKAKNKAHQVQEKNISLNIKIKRLESTLKQVQSTLQQNEQSHQELLNQQIQQIQNLHSTVNQLHHLKHQNNQLESKIKQLQHLVDEKESKITQQNNRISQLTNQVEQSADKLLSSQKQFSSASKQIQAAKHQLQSVNKNLTNCKQQLSNLRTQNSELSAKNQQLVRQSINLKHQATQHQKLIYQLQSEKESLSRQDNNLIDQLKSKVISLMNIINEKESFIKDNQLNHKQSVKELKHSIQIKDQQIHQLNNQVITLKNSIKTIEASLQKQNNKEPQSAQQNNKQVKNERTFTRAHSYSSNQRNNRTSSQNPTYPLQNMIQKHRDEILALHKLLRQKDQQLLKLKQQLSIPNDQIPDCNNNKLSNNKELNLKQIKKPSRSPNNFQEQNSDISCASITNNFAEVNLLRLQLQQVRNILASREQSYNRLLKERDQTIDKQLHIVNQKDQQLKKLNQEIRKLNEQVKKLNEQKKKLNQEIRKFKVQQKTIQNLKEQNMRKVKQIQSLNEKLEHKITQLSKEKRVIAQVRQQSNDQNKIIEKLRNQLISIKNTLALHQNCTVTKENLNINSSKNIEQTLSNKASYRSTSPIISPSHRQSASNNSEQKANIINQNNNTNLHICANDSKNELFEIHNFVKVYVKNPQQASFIVTHHDPKQEYELEICSHQHLKGNEIFEKKEEGKCQLVHQKQNIVNQEVRIIQNQKSVRNEVSYKETQQRSPHKFRTIFSQQQIRNPSPQKKKKDQNPSQRSRSQEGSKSQIPPITYPPTKTPITKETNQPTERTDRAKSLNVSNSKSGELNRFYLENIVPQFFGKKKNSQIQQNKK